MPTNSFPRNTLQAVRGSELACRAYQIVSYETKYEIWSKTYPSVLQKLECHRDFKNSLRLGLERDSLPPVTSFIFMQTKINFAVIDLCNESPYANFQTL